MASKAPFGRSCVREAAPLGMEYPTYLDYQRALVGVDKVTLSSVRKARFYVTGATVQDQAEVAAEPYRS